VWAPKIRILGIATETDIAQSMTPVLGSGPTFESFNGIVPIRYVVGVIPNVVPVETVTINAIGVVPCRVEVGPANVVPVRETNTEVPRVKIILSV